VYRLELPLLWLVVAAIAAAAQVVDEIHFSLASTKLSKSKHLQRLATCLQIHKSIVLFAFGFAFAQSVHQQYF